MADIESSIIIPVYNKWELTRNCLKSLASTLPQGRSEVIVVDNASSDVTPQASQFLGKQLFGENFSYLRNEQNRNFAGACNQGADAARGNFLIFLNNDTVAEPGWYEPLIADFCLYPDIAGTGPLLVYPDTAPWGRQVQHLGVIVSPILRFGHLYNGISEASSLARKRRFFQAITGACLVMKKSVFMDAGKFDERFVNGFEDVDLCARLVVRGLRFTVNPEAVVVHYEGQTPGRAHNDDKNFKFLWDGNIRFFHPDWDTLLEKDGFTLTVNNWVQLQPRLAETRLAELNKALPDMDYARLRATLCDNIYWREGWERLLAETRDQRDYLGYFKIYFKFFRDIPNAAVAVRVGEANNDRELRQRGESILKNYRKTPEELLTEAKLGAKWCHKLGLADMAGKYEVWVKNYDYFRYNIYPHYEEEYFGIFHPY